MAKEYLKDGIPLKEELHPIDLLLLFATNHNENSTALKFLGESQRYILKTKKDKFENKFMEQFYLIYSSSNVISHADKLISKNGFQLDENAENLFDW